MRAIGRLRRGTLVRAVGLGVPLALLLTAGEARAAKYAVAQCGWHIGADADWDDSTGGAKFRRDAYCATPSNADPFDGVHMKSFVRPGQAPTVSGSRYARWRWVAPSGTGIVKAQGTWWHTLHDGFEHRLGTTDGAGSFHVFAADSRTNTTLRSFVAGFSDPRRTFQSRLLCARAQSKHCDLSPTSWSSVRAVTLTLEDNGHPGASLGGELLDGGWRRGMQSVSVGAGDGGSGVRFSGTSVDGNGMAETEFDCAKAMIGGSWHATKMQPCGNSVSATQRIDTRSLSDGSHSVYNCSRDFAGNVGCTGVRSFLVDNNPPAIAFDTDDEAAGSGAFVARAVDAHSGPVSGAIFYRRAGVPAWTELETELREEESGVATLRAELAVDLVEPGLYELRAEGGDAAGNETSTTQRSDGAEMTLKIEPPPPPPPPPPPAQTKPPAPPAGPGQSEKGSELEPRPRRVRTRLFGRLKRGRRLEPRLTVRFGTRAKLVGRLVRADGAGLAGRKLLVVSRPSRGALAKVRRRSVVTGRRGGFRIGLPAGPSRRLAVRFGGDAGLAPSRRPDLALRVRGGVLLRLAKRRLRTGQLLRIGGRVRARGTALPRRGKLVAIQYFEADTRRWRPVLVTRSDRAGRFRARYRFRYVTGTARIRLRAVALPEEGWPYAPGASRPRLVRVKG